MTKRESLDKLFQEMKECNECFKSSSRAFCDIPRFVDSNVTGIGYAPSKQRKIPGLVFGGKSKEVFERFLSLTGISRDKIYLTNTVKCYSRNRYGSAEHCYWRFLSREIRMLDPEFVLVFGRDANEIVLGSHRPLNAHIEVRKDFVFKTKTTFISLPHPCMSLYRPEKLDYFLSLADKVKGILSTSSRLDKWLV